MLERCQLSNVWNSYKGFWLCSLPYASHKTSPHCPFQADTVALQSGWTLSRSLLGPVHWPLIYFSCENSRAVQRRFSFSPKFQSLLFQRDRGKERKKNIKRQFLLNLKTPRKWLIRRGKDPFSPPRSVFAASCGRGGLNPRRCFCKFLTSGPLYSLAPPRRRGRSRPAPRTPRAAPRTRALPPPRSRAAPPAAAASVR